MKLRNKEERKAFLTDYKNWELWKAVPELGIELYRYLFDNGDQIIVTEYTRNAERYVLAEGIECKYHLLLTQSSEYRDFEPNRSFTHYEPNGVAMGTIVDYLTKRRDIEV